LCPFSEWHRRDLSDYEPLLQRIVRTVPTRWAEESAVVWFRWKLLGDEAAGAYFKNMPNTDDWDLQQFDPG
jgi:hypothetical protein